MGHHDAKPIGEGKGELQTPQSELSEESRSERSTGLILFDPAEPRSVYNLVPAKMREALDRVNPNIWQYSLKALTKHAKVDERLAQLRVSFWHEYNRTQDLFKKNISMTQVMHGICSHEYFYQSILKDQMKLAYLMYPTTDYIAAMQEMQDLAMREMRKILLLPNAGKNGTSIVREKIKIFALLDNRLRGAVPKHIKKESQHLHAHMKIDQQAAPKSVEDIQREINRIERTVKTAIKAPKEESINSPGDEDKS